MGLAVVEAMVVFVVRWWLIGANVSGYIAVLTTKTEGVMPQKNLKDFPAVAFKETAIRLRRCADELDKLALELEESNMESVPVAHHANFQEALRRIMVFVGNANEQMAMTSLDKHFD